MDSTYNKVQLACLILLYCSLLVQSQYAVKPKYPSTKCQVDTSQCEGSYLARFDSTCPDNQQLCFNIPEIHSTGECEEEGLHIITRDSWGAQKPIKTVPMATPVNYFILHHSAGFWFDHCDSQSECIEKVKDIQDDHMNENKWDDIGYQYLIGGDGSVFEGRTWRYEGSQAPGYNNISIGVCMIGNFMDKQPTSEAKTALSKLYTCLQRMGKLTSTHSVYGHRDVRQTECPGDNYYPTLKETFGESWRREDPPEYYTECRLRKGKCQKDTDDCDGEYHVRTWWPYGTLLCPDYEEDDRIKCCIKNK